MINKTSFFTRNAEAVLAVLFTLFLAFQYHTDRLWLAHTASAKVIFGIYLLLLCCALFAELFLLFRARKTAHPYYLLTCIPLAVYLSGAAETMLLPWLTLSYFVLVGVVRLVTFFRCRARGDLEQKRNCSAMLTEFVLALCLLFSRFITFADLYSIA